MGRYTDPPVHFSWEFCAAVTRSGLHPWVIIPPDMGRGRRNLYRCSRCGVVAWFSQLEMDRWAVLMDERASARRRGQKDGAK